MEIRDQSDSRMHYDEKLGHLQAEVHAIHKRLDAIADDIRSSKAQPKTHVYAVMVGVVGALITIGTFALTPVNKDLHEIKTRLHNAERAVAMHDADGHPEAVLRVIDGLDKVHTRERQHNRNMLDKFEARIDSAEKDIAELNVVAEERTIRMQKALEYRDERIDSKAKDRWTGGQQKVFARAIEQRIRELEKRLNAQNAQ